MYCKTCLDVFRRSDVKLLINEAISHQRSAEAVCHAIGRAVISVGGFGPSLWIILIDPSETGDGIGYQQSLLFVRRVIEEK